MPKTFDTINMSRESSLKGSLLKNLPLQTPLHSDGHHILACHTCFKVDTYCLRIFVASHLSAAVLSWADPETGPHQCQWNHRCTSVHVCQLHLWVTADKPKQSTRGTSSCKAKIRVAKHGYQAAQ